jgi:hypothetical protein
MRFEIIEGLTSILLMEDSPHAPNPFPRRKRGSSTTNSAASQTEADFSNKKSCRSSVQKIPDAEPGMNDNERVSKKQAGLTTTWKKRTR